MQYESKEIVVYTVNFGNKDQEVIQEKFKEASYFYFTDNAELQVDGWTMVVVDKPENYRRTARWYKTHPHELFPNAVYSVWQDARIVTTVPLWLLIFEAEERHIAIKKHPRRSCIYEEAQFCLDHEVGNASQIKKQIKRYKAIHYPKDNGLFETGVVVRKHTKFINEFNELWWSEIEQYSERDQLSCNYCLWQLDIKPKELPSKYMIIGKHIYNDR
jgi:hypothetical protein